MKKSPLAEISPLFHDLLRYFNFKRDNYLSWIKGKGEFERYSQKTAIFVCLNIKSL